MAVQRLADEQETAFTAALAAPGGVVGVGRIDQVLPFHFSASGPVRDDPTAVHEVADGQDTLPRLGWSVVASEVGFGWIDHSVPFQRSTSDPVAPPLARYCPTAVQADAELQETPANVASMAVAGIGVGRIVQAVPFQDSASGPADACHPTAIHREADEQDTPVSTLVFHFGSGTGTGWIAHLVPFHFSASGTPLLVWPWPEDFVL